MKGVDKTKKLSILLVHNYYQIPGGEDTVVANEKRLLEEHGHKVILYSRNNAELKEMSMIQKLCLPITTVFNPRTFQDIKRLVKTEKRHCPCSQYYQSDKPCCILCREGHEGSGGTNNA